MRKTMSGIISRTKSNLVSAKKTLKTILNNKAVSRRTFMIVPAAFLITVTLISFVSFDVSYAVAVSCNGETVGYVSSKAVYDTALNNIADSCEGDAKEVLSNVDISEQVASVGDILNAEELETAIIDSVEELSENYGLYKNDELYAVLKEKSQAEETLEKYLKDNSKGTRDADYVDDFEVKKGYYNPEDIIEAASLYNKLSEDETVIGLYKIEIKTRSVDFETETKKSDKYPEGETVVVKAGEKGKEKLIQKVYYENGKKIEATTISVQTVKEPKNQKEIKGTAERFTLSFPLKSGYYISSDYGEWRGYYAHQGVDIVANYGTPIYAAAPGKILEASYSSGGWGINVLIDHGNGIKTRYAHCSSVSVSVGQTVERGEKIAEVGATGEAYCNHCHFEAYNGSARVNPANYY